MNALFPIIGLLSYYKKDLDCLQFARLGVRVYVLTNSSQKLYKNSTANQMARIAFSTCEDNDTSNRVSHILGFGVTTSRLTWKRQSCRYQRFSILGFHSRNEMKWKIYVPPNSMISGTYSERSLGLSSGRNHFSHWLFKKNT